MAYRNPTDAEIEIGVKAAKARGVGGRDQVKWAVDMWHIHMGKMRKPAGWKDPWAAKKPAAKPKKTKSK